MLRHSIKRCLSGLSLLLISLNSGAESTQLAPLQVTANKESQSTHELSQAVTVLDQQQLNNNVGALLPELLHGQSGVFVQQTTPGQGNTIIRGLKGSEVLHLVDGMRLNHAFFRNAPNQYLALIDPFLLEQVEIIRGPSPTLYGADAMGGVVNLISQKPKISGTQWQQRNQLKWRYNSADHSTASRIESSFGTKRLQSSIGLSYQDSQKRRIGGGQRLPHTTYSSRAADLGLRWQTSENQQWRLDVQHLRQPSTPRYDQLVAGFGESQPRRAEFRFEPSQRDFIHLTGRFFAPFKAADELELHWAYQNLQDNTRRRNLNSEQRDLEENRSEYFAWTAQAYSQLTDQQGIRYGLELYRDQVLSHKQRVDLSTNQSLEVESRFPHGSRLDSYAAYVQHDLAFGNKGQHRLSLGSRASHFRLKLPQADSQPVSQLNLNDLTGHIALRLQLQPALALVSNIGRGFRPPNIFDLGALGPRPGNRFNEPNPQLKAEQVYSYDLGLKFQSANYLAEFFLYYSDYQDKISSVATGRLTAAGENIVRSENVQSLQLHGFEALLHWQISHHWQSRLLINQIRGHEVSAAGQKTAADRIPPLNLHWRLQWQSENWQFAAEIWAAGRQDRLSPRDLTDSRINPEGTAGFARWDLQARWQPSSHWQLGLRAVNLTDKRYREHGSGLDAAGRGIQLDVNYRWD